MASEKTAAWNPVSDGAPPQNGCLYLLFVDDGIFTHLALGERVGDEWWDDEERIQEHVTHWAELPDAPGASP